MRDDRRLTRALVVAAAVEADRIKRYAVARKPLDTPTKLLAFLRDQGGDTVVHMAAGEWLWKAAFGKPGQAAGEKPVTAGAAEIGLAAAAI